MAVPRDSLDVARVRRDNVAMESSAGHLARLTSEPASATQSSQEESILSPVSVTSFADQRATFGRSSFSPGGEGESLSESRSRTGSLSSVLSETRLFRSSKRKPKRNRDYRDKAARPVQPDILDKPATRKLTKFWKTTEEDAPVSPPQPAQVILRHLSTLTSDTSRLPSIYFEGVPYGLPSISEDPLVLTGFAESRSVIMDPSRLAPESLQPGEKKQKAIQDAKDMYQLVRRNCERTNTAVPPYDFVELIGKGAFGRVYKCKEHSTGKLVAIKIVNTDEVDYQQDILDKDDTIRDFRKEVTILQQLKDSNAKNVNMIHGAFDLQEQLWIVSDYCTGGSIRTLMRAQPASHAGLEEQYIIPIARELAVAMKSVHDIGVIHRDIKCTNVYVTEEGEIQLGDFGIVGVLDDGVSKRQTMIGTPHYMPREMHIHGSGNQVAEAYGTEVDVWSFGCSVYEMATGQPPNAVKRQDMLKIELLNAPRLEGGTYSQELRDFIAFCLNSDPKARPTADEVLRHPYLANTLKKYPTRKLAELIVRYKAWEYSGGWRQSLFFAGGAPPVAGTGEQSMDTGSAEFDDWNFSTSDGFNEAFEKRYSQMMSSEGSSSLHLETQNGTGLPAIVTDLTPYQQVQQRQKELSASRGERSLERIFTTESEPYELHTPVDLDSPTSDLPLRKLTGGGPTRESHILIDLDTGGAESVPSFNFDFGDVPTLKARSYRTSSQDDEEEDDYRYRQSKEDREKRATMEWTFPAVKRATMDWAFPTSQTKEADDTEARMGLSSVGEESEYATGLRPTLKHTTTEPIGQFRDYMHPPVQQLASHSPVRDSMRSMIDLDLGLSDPADIVRPSTASSATGSTMTDATSGNPFDLEEDPAQKEIDRSRFSYHKQWQSEGGQLKRSSRRSVPMHARGSSLSSTASELDRASASESDDVFNFDYSRRVSETMRNQLNGTTARDSVDLNQWPDFGTDSSFDKMRPYADPLDGMVTRQRGLNTTHEQRPPVNGNVFRQPSTVGGIQPEVEFPRILGPHPDALREDADPHTAILELDRLLDDLGEGLRVTANAFEQLLGDEDYDGSDTNESGLDISAAMTEEESS